MNILIAVPFLLHDNVKHGGGKQILKLAQGLIENGHKIFLMCISESETFSSEKQCELWNSCTEVKIFTRSELKIAKRIYNSLNPFIPSHARNIVNKEARQYIRTLSDSGTIDVFYIAYSIMGEYAECVDKTKNCLILDTIEVATRKYSLSIKANKNLISYFNLFLKYFSFKIYEKKLFESASALVAISDEEKAYIKKYSNPKEILLMPSLINKKDKVLLENCEKNDTILFFGSFNHSPNLDAIVWFCKEIFPIINKKLPDVIMNIVGENAKEKLANLIEEKDGIKIIGTVPEIQPWIMEATVVVSPIISGGGARIKNIETLAMGKPLVTTSLGAEGISCEKSKGFLVENDPVEFANAVVNLLQNKKQRKTIGEFGQKEIQFKHDNVFNATNLESLCTKLLKRGKL